MPLSVCVAVPIQTSRYTQDTILYLREVSDIPQMQYFGMFITCCEGSAGLVHPSTVVNSPLLFGFLLWLEAESTRRWGEFSVASPLFGPASRWEIEY